MDNVKAQTLVDTTLAAIVAEVRTLSDTYTRCGRQRIGRQAGGLLTVVQAKTD